MRRKPPRLPERATLDVTGGVAQSENVFTWADHTRCDEQYVVKVDPDTKKDVTAIIGCAVMTGAGAVINTADVQKGESVAVFGVGGVGLSAVVGAKMVGANPIIAVDLDDAKLEFAKKFGATHGINAARSTVIDAIHDLTGKTASSRSPVSPLAASTSRSTASACARQWNRSCLPCRSGHFGERTGGTAVSGWRAATPVELNAIDVLVNEKQLQRQHRRLVCAGSRLPAFSRVAREWRSRISMRW